MVLGACTAGLFQRLGAHALCVRAGAGVRIAGLLPRRWGAWLLDGGGSGAHAFIRSPDTVRAMSFISWRPSHAGTSQVRAAWDFPNRFCIDLPPPAGSSSARIGSSDNIQQFPPEARASFSSFLLSKLFLSHTSNRREACEIASSCGLWLCLN